MIFVQVILVLFIIVLAVWRRDIFFYLMAAPVTIVFGLMWRSNYNTTDGMVVALALIATGIYCFIMGLYNILRKTKVI